MFLPNDLLPLGARVPDFRLLDHRGYSVGLDDFSHRRGTVLLFFASDWLKADLALLSAYRDAYPQFLEADLQILALSSMNWENLFHLGRHLNAPFPILFDQCCRQSTFYKSAWVPKFVTGRAIYGLDARKKIVFAQKQAAPQLILNAFSG
jgi:peroxiredoxin